jgi:hypothetical protein
VTFPAFTVGGGFRARVIVLKSPSGVSESDMIKGKGGGGRGFVIEGE